MCLRAASDPCDRLSSTTTSAAPPARNSSALAEPTRLAPPTIRKRPPLMARDFGAGGDATAAGMGHPLRQMRVSFRSSPPPTRAASRRQHEPEGSCSQAPRLPARATHIEIAALLGGGVG